MTERTPEEITGKFKRILEEKGNLEDIDAMLAQYPSIPKFVSPYLHAIYFKNLDEPHRAAGFMDEAITELQSDPICRSSKDFIDKTTYYII